MRIPFCSAHAAGNCSHPLHIASAREGPALPPYIFGIAGWSKSGKTTLVERLIFELTRRGHRLGTLKHDGHGFVADHPGKDTWRHRAAGAVATIITGPDQFALFRQGTPPGPDELVPMLGDVDMVLAEGFKGAAWPKIEVHRGSGALACAGDPWLVAVAGPEQPRGLQVPWYHWNEIVEIADAIVNARSLGLSRR